MSSSSNPRLAPTAYPSPTRRFAICLRVRSRKVRPYIAWSHSFFMSGGGSYSVQVDALGLFPQDGMGRCASCTFEHKKAGCRDNQVVEAPWPCCMLLRWRGHAGLTTAAAAARSSCKGLVWEREHVGINISSTIDAPSCRGAGVSAGELGVFRELACG